MDGNAVSGRTAAWEIAARDPLLHPVSWRNGNGNSSVADLLYDSSCSERVAVCVYISERISLQ